MKFYSKVLHYMCMKEYITQKGGNPIGILHWSPLCEQEYFLFIQYLLSLLMMLPLTMGWHWWYKWHCHWQLTNIQLSAQGVKLACNFCQNIHINSVMGMYFCDFYSLLVLCSAVEVLTMIMKDRKLSGVFRHQQGCLNHNLPLGAYLLKPVQRILKYHLLLQVI